MDVAVVGLGLIGGSVLRALASRGHRVLGHDADPAARETARAAAVRMPAAARWEVADHVHDLAAATDLVVIAVPLPAVSGVLDQLAASDFAGVVTDVTSVKAPVYEAVAHLQHRDGRLARFVGGHPMAGREVAGFANSDADLFTDCVWALCLEPEAAALADWLEVAAVVTGIGARVVPATPAGHDRAVATISHVPHLLAAALSTTVAADPLAGTLAAGSFRDATRVAASPPDLVAAMCGGNAAALEPALDELLDTLGYARSALRAEDPIAALLPWLAGAAAARTAWPPEAGTTSQLPVDVDALLRLGREGGWITQVAGDRRTVSAVTPAASPRSPEAGGLP